MSKLVIRRKTCRLCNGNELELVLKLAPTPIGDAYVPREGTKKIQECYPLEIYLCKSCGLSQLLDVIDPEAVYSNYIYHTSDSSGLVKHFEDYVDSILHRINPPKNSLAIDIGSNDGSLLRFFKKSGMRVLGIDPAKEIARKATESGIETLPTFFTLELARKIRNERGSAHIITTNNTFANVDDLTNMMEGVKELLSQDGIFVFETGYFLDLIQKTIFDNIYHEHLSYFSVKPLENFFISNGMELIDVERVPTKGGSIRCIIQLKGSSRKASSSVNQLIKLETELGIHDVETIKKFGNKLEAMKNKLMEILRDLKSKGKTVVGYGASVEVTTMLYYFNLDSNLLEFIVDDNPMRQNLYSPGLHIPVLSSQAIYERKPDYVLLLAWQYSEPIMKKNQKYLEQGGHFILLLPSLQVVNNKGMETKSKIDRKSVV